MAKCPMENLKNGSLTPQCSSLVTTAMSTVGPYYAYNILDDCSNNPDPAVMTSVWGPSVTARVSRIRGVGGKSTLHMHPSHPFNEKGAQSRRSRQRTIGAQPAPSAYQVGEEGFWCPGPAMGIWVNRSDVRAALNVPEDSYFFNGDNGVGFK